MAFTEGNKLGKGRPKGVPNKDVKEIRELIKEIAYKILESKDKFLQNKTPDEQLEILLKLLPYVCPKPETIKEVVDDESGNEGEEIFTEMVRATRPSQIPSD